MLEVAHATLRPQLRGVNASQRPCAVPKGSVKQRLRRSPRTARCALDVGPATEEVQALEVRRSTAWTWVALAVAPALQLGTFSRLHRPV